MELERFQCMEDVKTYQKEKNEQKKDKPSFALTLKYLSNESLEDMKKGTNWDTIEANVDPEGLWKIVEEKHEVHSACEIDSIVKLAMRMHLQSIKQGGFESVISYKQR